MPQVIGIIPARYGSTRFPGKPLAPILGKSLIQHTYENAIASQSFDAIWIATDNDNIEQHVRSFTQKVLRTSSQCPSGTDRVIEAIKAIDQGSSEDIIINIQGDEPCVPPPVFFSLIQSLNKNPSVGISTPIRILSGQEEVLNPNCVKCVVNLNGEALYFSRNMIPGNKSASFDPSISYFGHIGLYAFRKSFLMQYSQLPATPLQLTEDLEQLKILEHGFKIQTVVVSMDCLGVDTPEDINKIELYLCNRNSFL